MALLRLQDLAQQLGVAYKDLADALSNVGYPKPTLPLELLEVRRASYQYSDEYEYVELYPYDYDDGEDEQEGEDEDSDDDECFYDDEDDPQVSRVIAAAILGLSMTELQDTLHYLDLDHEDNDRNLTAGTLKLVIEFLADPSMEEVYEGADPPMEEVYEGGVLEVDAVSRIVRLPPDDVDAAAEYLSLKDRIKMNGGFQADDIREILDFIDGMTRFGPETLEASPSPPANSKAAQPGRKVIDAGTTGVTYADLFFPWLEGATHVTLTDPFVANSLQLSNLAEFLETLYGRRGDGGSIRVSLRTVAAGDRERERQKQGLEDIQRIFRPFSIELIVDFLERKYLHDRGIVSDNGWTIDLGRGLDIYEPQGRHKFDPRGHVQALRRAKPFTISYHRL